jgi:hypothetical protein
MTMTMAIIQQNIHCMKVTMLRNIITQLTITDPTVRMLDSRHMTVTMLH